MSDWTDQILDAIQRVSILDYRKDEATGRPSKVGEQTAAMIFNAVRAAEGRAIDPAEDWQTSNNDDWSIPYTLTMGEILDGRPAVRLPVSAGDVAPCGKRFCKMRSYRASRSRWYSSRAIRSARIGSMSMLSSA